MSSGARDFKVLLKAHGYYAASFRLNGTVSPSLPELAEWMQGDGPRYTGWPPFWWPTRSEITPRVVDQGTYECLHDGTGMTGAIERWRASTAGLFTILRAYDSDRDEDRGQDLELTMPAWRIGELVLYAGRMATRFHSETVDFTVRFEGLAGRALRSSWAPPWTLIGHYTTDASRYERRVALATEDIETGVIEMTDNLIRGLFELFQFPLPETLCEVEITRMRSNRY